jgi:WD40 repeat protein
MHYGPELLQSYAALYAKGGGIACRLAFSPTGLLAVRGSCVEVWNTAALEEPIGAFPASIGMCRPAWSPDGSRLAIGDGIGEGHSSASTCVSIWDVSSEECLSRFEQEDRALLTALAWSPDGRYIASCSRAPSLKVWGARWGEVLWSALSCSDPTLLAWSPDSHYLAANLFAPWIVTLWQVQTHNVARTLDEGEHAPYKVLEGAFSPDGTRLAVGTDVGYVMVWYLGEECEEARLALHFPYHMDRITGLAWSPDGDYLLSGSCDHHVALWRAATGDLLYVSGSRGSDNVIEDVAWAPDNSCLAVCDSVGVVSLFRVPPLLQATQERRQRAASPGSCASNAKRGNPGF